MPPQYIPFLKNGKTYLSPCAEGASPPSDSPRAPRTETWSAMICYKVGNYFSTLERVRTVVFWVFYSI